MALGREANGRKRRDKTRHEGADWRGACPSSVGGRRAAQARRFDQVPVVSQFPLVGWLLRGNNKEKTQTEIVMIVTAKLAEE